MLDEFGAEIEHADSRLDATMKKMAKVLHLSDGKCELNMYGFNERIRNHEFYTSTLYHMSKTIKILHITDRRQWMAIGALSSALLVVLFLFMLM